MRWIYTAMIRPVITYAYTFWVGEVNKKFLEKNFQSTKTSVTYENILRAGASFHIEYASGSQTDQNFVHLGRYSTVFQAEVFAIAKVAKKLIMDRIVNEKIIILVDNQAAILAIQNYLVKSSTNNVHQKPEYIG